MTRDLFASIITRVIEEELPLPIDWPHDIIVVPWKPHWKPIVVEEGPLRPLCPKTLRFQKKQAGTVQYWVSLDIDNYRDYGND